MKRACGHVLAMVTDSWLLGAEAAMVVPLRLTRLALGGAPARNEARRMVNEKIAGNRALWRAIRRGDFGLRPDAVMAGSAAFYLRRVRANRRRLARSLLG